MSLLKRLLDRIGKPKVAAAPPKWRVPKLRKPRTRPHIEGRVSVIPCPPAQYLRHRKRIRRNQMLRGA